MNISGSITKLRDGLNILKFNNIPDSYIITIKEGLKGLSLYGKNGKYSIEYGSKTDFFRGLAILDGMLKRGDNEINLKEERLLDSCGVMIDCSRNAVPKVETLKDIFCRMAKMGLNLVLLYTEETYEMSEYPYFGYMRGRYTKDELKELDKCALSLGIELVPCIQTLAHLDMALRWPQMAHMADTDRALMVDNEETYKFIEEMIKTCKECFSTDKIHIGMDEAHNLGTGKFLDKFGYESSDSIFLRHLKRVNEIIKKYNYKPMMWDDMFFRYSSKKGAYYDLDTVLCEDIKKEIPENISQVFWNYYKETNEEYEIYFNQRKDLKNEIIFAGGIWTWYTLGMCYNKTFRATRPALEECHKFGIKTVFGTIWDGGHGGYLDIYATLLGMQLYAEFMYNKTVSDELVKERFKLCTGYDMDSFMALDFDCYPPEWCHEYPYEADTQDPNVSKQVLYQDLLLGLFDKNFESVDLKADYFKKLKRLETVNVPKDLEYLFDYYKTIISILYDKCDLGIRITKAYKTKNTQKMKELISEIENIKNKFVILKEQMYIVWHKEHKAFGWEISDLRLSATIGRLDTVKRKLNDFCCDGALKIEELEEERLLFGPANVKDGKSLVSALRYPWISTPSLNIR